MQGLGVLKESVRNNGHMLNSVRTEELQRITRAQRMLSSLYSEIKPKAKVKTKKVVSKIAKKKGKK